MRAMEKIKLLCSEENIGWAKLKAVIFEDFVSRYEGGDTAISELIYCARKKCIVRDKKRLLILDYLAKNPGSTYDEVPVKGASVILCNMAAYGVVAVSGVRRSIGRGRPKNEYTLK